VCIAVWGTVAARLSLAAAIRPQRCSSRGSALRALTARPGAESAPSRVECMRMCRSGCDVQAALQRRQARIGMCTSRIAKAGLAGAPAVAERLLTPSLLARANRWTAIRCTRAWSQRISCQSSRAQPGPRSPSLCRAGCSQSRPKSASAAAAAQARPGARDTMGGLHPRQIARLRRAARSA